MNDRQRIKVLVAEDEPHLGAVLAQFLIERGCEVTACADGRAALDALRAEAFDVALLDVLMPGLDGLEVLRAVREDAAPPEVIIITGNASIETAIGAMKLGAYDYLSKPYRMAEIDVLVRRAYEKRRLRSEHAMMSARLARLDDADEIVTQYAPLKAVLAMVARVARSDTPVLITGESGTGKDVVARMIHADHRAPRDRWWTSMAPRSRRSAWRRSSSARSATPRREARANWDCSRWRRAARSSSTRLGRSIRARRASCCARSRTAPSIAPAARRRCTPTSA